MAVVAVGDNGGVTNQPPEPQPELDQARIRRAPKIPAFLIVGGGLGAIATLILTSLFPADPNVGFGALFGYFALYGVTAGVVLGAVLAIILDRASARRARMVAVEREVVPPHEDEPTDPSKADPSKADPA